MCTVQVVPSIFGGSTGLPATVCSSAIPKVSDGLQSHNNTTASPLIIYLPEQVISTISKGNGLMGDPA